MGNLVLAIIILSIPFAFVGNKKASPKKKPAPKKRPIQKPKELYEKDNRGIFVRVK